MRVVGKIQAAAPRKSGAWEDVRKVVSAWAAEKFDALDSGAAVIRHSKVEALVEQGVEELPGYRHESFEVLEPIDGGDLQTRIRLLETETRVHLHCTLGISSDAGVAPPKVDIFVPRLVRQIIGLPLEWQASGSSERLFGHSFDVDDIEQLVALTTSSLRKLPLVLVSDLNGRPLAGNLHSLLASDLCGLGHVCRLGKDAAWELTKRQGKPWSCYNGAVRLFWPFRGNRDDPRNHPLWTYDYLTRLGGTELEARDRLRHRLRESLLEASTFVADDPQLARFETAKLQAAAQTKAAISNDDLLAIADAQIASLRQALAERDLQIATLSENIASLTTRAYAQTAADEGDVAGEEEPPETVAEAVEIVKQRYGQDLALPDALAEQVASLNPSAGPPEKVLRYLATLAELSRALSASDSIGKSIPTWLEERGVKCSGESETKSKNAAARRRRTFQVQGANVLCELHAKPSDAVAPDQCVRIYFAPATQAPCIQIGYIGRHFE